MKSISKTHSRLRRLSMGSMSTNFFIASYKLMVVVLFVSFLACTTSVNAQTFEKGDVLISPGLGLGLYGVGYGIGFAVPLTLNVDVGVSDYVSAGGFVSHWGKTWDYSLYGKYKFRSTHAGVRGSFHWGKYLKEELDIDLIPEKMDLYVTGWLGFNVRKATWVPSDNSSIFTNDLGWENRAQAGAQLGARYFPKKNLGFFAEWGGTPAAYSNWGITIKF
jgi:hypothetical protein